MNNKLILTLGGALIVVFIALPFIQNRKNQNSEVSVQSFGNRKGIFVGEAKMNPMNGSPTKSDEMKRVDEHRRELVEVDKAHDHIEKGDLFSRQGDFEKAAEEYKQAYAINAGFSKAVSGLLLAQTYEKMGRYEEGMSILDQMVQNGNLSDQGIQNANEIRTRLLAAKNQSSQS